MNPPRPMKGTGNLVQDLIASTSVLVEKYNFTQIDTKVESLSVSPEQSSISCSICSTRQGDVRPFTLQEMGILQEFVLSKYFVSTTTFTLICSPCSTTLLKLTQLFVRIEQIVVSLWTAIRFQGDKNKPSTSLSQTKSLQPPTDQDQSPDLNTNLSEYNYDLVSESDLPEQHPAPLPAKMELSDIEEQREDNDTHSDNVREGDSSPTGSEVTREKKGQNIEMDEALAAVEKHEEGPTAPKGGKYPCDECPQHYNLLRHYLLHKGSHQPKKGPFRCHPCNKTMAKMSTYSAHLVTGYHLNRVGGEYAAAVRKRKKVKCEECHQTFVTERQLQGHKQTHKVLEITCETCGRQARSESELKTHQLTHEARIPGRFVDPENKPYPCPHCEKRFMNRPQISVHVKSVHEGKTFPCDLCPKTFKYPRGMIRHKQTAHTSTKKQNVAKKVGDKVKIQCDICPVTRAEPGYLRTHIELKHFPEKASCPYGCPDTNFTTEEEWKTHLEQCGSEKLTEASKCVCSTCGAVFRSQLLRIAHHLSLHKTYSCEFCPMRCTTSATLEVHTKGHKEYRPFLCVKCGKRFRSLSDYNVHSKIVCGDDEETKRKMMEKRKEQYKIFRDKAKSHKCDECSKMFVDEARLEKHKKKVHQHTD